MKCNNHNTLEADGACVICGLTFCRECLVEFDNKYYCKEHMVEKVKERRDSDYNTKKKKKKKKKKGNDARWVVSLILCIFLGYLGAHRFYLGRWGTGLIWLFTGGLFGIGYLIDIVLIFIGELD